MERNLNLKVGQEVVIRCINSSIRYLEDKSLENIDNWTLAGTVEKVTKKYIHVTINGKIEKFDVEFDYIQKVNRGESDYKLYESKEELINEVEAATLYSDIRNCFNNSLKNNRELTLDQLQRIKDIIEESKH